MKLYKIPLQKLNPPITFQPRHHSGKMSYRYYPSWSTHTLFLFHGLVSSSFYLAPLAHHLAERKIAQVIIPDWRGHGEDTRELNWLKDHDVIQDFEEILIQIKSRTAMERISFMGHSFGAQWALRILKEAPSFLKVDHLFLLAPFLSHSQLKPNWLELKNSSYQVNWPEGIRTGKERVHYPREFLDFFGDGFEILKEISAKTPTYVVEAEQDEILRSMGSVGGVKEHRVLDQATHMGLVMESQCVEKISDLVESHL